MALATFEADHVDGLIGTLNPFAALQHSLFAYTIYQYGPTQCAERAAVATDGGNVVLAVNARDPDWTDLPTAKPVYVLWQQDDKLWLHIKGTYTSAQWLANTYGWVARSALGGSTQDTFHRAWATMAEAVWADVNALIGANSLPLNVSGHSLGGAVGWMVAVLAKRAKPERAVNCLTLGAPREMMGVCDAPTPTQVYNVQVAGDPVVKVPPNVTNLPPQWQVQPPTSRQVIYPDGTLAKPDKNDGELLSSVTPSNWYFSNHSPNTYTLAWRAYAENQEIQDAATTRVINWQPRRAEPLAIEELLQPEPLPTPTPLSGLQPPVTSPPAAPVPSGFQGGNMPFLVRMTFGYAKWGWTEEHYWTGRDLATCWQDAYTLADLRRKCLQTNCTLEQLSVRPCDNQGRVSDVGGGDFSYGPQGTGAGTSAPHGEGSNCNPAWRALYVRIFSNNRFYNRAVYLRGARPSTACPDVPTWVSYLSSVTSANKADFDRYLCFLCNGTCPPTGPQVPAETFERTIGPALGGNRAGTAFQSVLAAAGGAPNANNPTPLGNWSMRVRDKAVGRGNQFRIADVIVNPDTRSLWIKPGRQVKIDPRPQLGSLTLGQRIHLHGLTGGLQGTNGDTRVVEVGEEEPYLGYYRVATKQPCPCDYQYLQDATYWALSNALIPYGFARYGRVVTKKTGKPHFGTQGKAKKRCKKC